MTIALNTMPQSCGGCDDNFIVNTKSIRCNFCDMEYHTQCVRIKNAAYKAILESKNINFFCDGCLKTVKSKLRPGRADEGAISLEKEIVPTEQYIERHTRSITDQIECRFTASREERTERNKSSTCLSYFFWRS